MKSEFSEVSQMDELIAILKDIHPDVDYETATNLIDGKILDSFDIISLVSEINDKFDIVISAEYMIPENFNSAKALWDLIQKLEDEE
jgi:acyl carrier protein